MSFGRGKQWGQGDTMKLAKIHGTVAHQANGTMPSKFFILCTALNEHTSTDICCAGIDACSLWNCQHPHWLSLGIQLFH